MAQLIEKRYEITRSSSQLPGGVQEVPRFVHLPEMQSCLFCRKGSGSCWSHSWSQRYLLTPTPLPPKKLAQRAKKEKEADQEAERCEKSELTSPKKPNRKMTSQGLKITNEQAVKIVIGLVIQWSFWASASKRQMKKREIGRGKTNWKQPLGNGTVFQATDGT